MIDNLDRAMDFKGETQAFKDGLVMINNSFKNKLEILGIDFAEVSDEK